MGGVGWVAQAVIWWGGGPFNYSVTSSPVLELGVGLRTRTLELDWTWTGLPLDNCLSWPGNGCVNNPDPSSQINPCYLQKPGKKRSVKTNIVQ